MAILCKNATKKTVKVHRLVAEAFIQNSCKKIVNHIDSNKSNNFFQNLEWVSNLENSCHSRLKMKTSSNYVGVTFNKKTEFLEPQLDIMARLFLWEVLKMKKKLINQDAILKLKIKLK